MGQKEFDRFSEMTPEQLQNLSPEDEAKRKKIVSAMDTAASSQASESQTNTVVVKAEEGTSARVEGPQGDFMKLYFTGGF